MRTFKTWHDTELCYVTLDWIDGMPFVHLEVKEWSPSKAKQLLMLFAKLRMELHNGGSKYVFAYSVFQDEKFYKFLSFMGMRKLCEHNGLNVYFVETL